MNVKLSIFKFKLNVSTKKDSLCRVKSYQLANLENQILAKAIGQC